MLLKYTYQTFQPKMTISEAKKIFNIENFDIPTLKKRYITLIQLNHPDFGGSTLIAEKINEAKNLLEKNYENNKNS